MDAIFNQFPLFANLSTRQSLLVQSLFVCKHYPSDMVIFEQGDRAEYLYLVADGEVSIRFKPDDAPEINVSQIQPGDIFGWSAAFGSGRYTSGAVCTQDSPLLRVRGDDLRDLCQKHPETGILILKRLAELVAQRMNCENRHAQVVALLEHALENGVKPIGG
jgi:CRP-like cAMP-binding protein